MMLHQPLIILGMHRSGTSMISRVLRHQGLFLGHRRQDDDEAVFFLMLNLWILHVAGGDWDEPLPALRMLQDAGDAARLADILRPRLAGLRTYPFLGRHWLAARGRIAPGLPMAWGFKDPRSAITLPVWRLLFPGARFLRIRRHGMDVAESLRARNAGLRTILENLHHAPGRRLLNRGHIMDSVRCRTLEGALALWSEYESALDQALPGIPAEQQMTIRFEDYVADPAAHHRALSAFIGLPLDAPLPPGIGADPSRAFAYRRSPELAAEAVRLAERLAAGGYAP